MNHHSKILRPLGSSVLALVVSLAMTLPTRAQYPTPDLSNPAYTNGPFTLHTSPLLVGQCTWYVYGRIQEAGVISSSTLSSKGIFLHSPSSWVTDANGAGYGVGSQPVQGAVAVWTSGRGHVAFVEQVFNGVPQFSECNATPSQGWNAVVCRDEQDVGNWKVALRDNPNGSLVGYLPKFGVFSVVGGPTLANGYSWYHLQGSGYDGWTAFLEVETGNAADPYAPPDQKSFSWSFTRIKLQPSAGTISVAGNPNPDTYIYLAPPVAANYWYAFTNLAGMPATIGNVDGTGSAARFWLPYGVAVDSSGNVYVADTYNHTIRKLTPAGVVTTLAGSAGLSGSADGTGSGARFYYPFGLGVDSSGNVYVADSWNHTIRKVTPAGVVTTLAGSAGQPGSSDGRGTAARFDDPGGAAVDSNGNVYVADYLNHTIRKVTPAGVVTTLAGSTGSSGSGDGTGSVARFYHPSCVAVDSSGNAYVSDTDNNTIRKVTPAGVVTTLAGSAGSSGSADGIGSAARFFCPEGLAVDSSGNVYVADFYNDTIRKVTPAGVVTTLAGTAGRAATADGIGTAARFSNPSSVAVDSTGNLYVADTGNDRITKGVPVAPLQILTSTGRLGVSSGFFQCQLTGPSGISVIAERSADLKTWLPVQTNALPPEGLSLSIPVGTDPNGFFRARLGP